MSLLTVIRSELLCRLRMEPPHPLLATSVVALGTIAMVALWWAGSLSPHPAPILGSPTFGAAASANWRNALAPYRGSLLFFILSVGLIGMAAAVAPIAAAATLNRERDGRSIESLLLTGVGPWTVVLGKLLAALVRTLLVLAAAVPLLAVAWLFGGVSMQVVAATAVVATAFTLLSSAVALFMSSILRANLAAVLYSYMVLGLITVVVPGVFAIAVVVGGQAQWLPLLYLNSAVALLSASPELVAAIRPLLPFAWRDLALQTTSAWYGVSPAYPFLAATVTVYLTVSGVLLALSSALLDPFHPLRSFHLRVPVRGLRR